MPLIHYNLPVYHGATGEKKMKRRFSKTFLLASIISLFVLMVLPPAAARAQSSNVVIRPNPRNPKRKIIEISPIRRSLQQVNLLKNALDDKAFRQEPIPFQRFEMVHPTTRKPLDPNAKLTLTTPDGRSRTTTVKEYFEQLNELEMALSQRGHTLRDANAFANLRPVFTPRPAPQAPRLPTGFSFISQAEYESRKAKVSSGSSTPLIIGTLSQVPVSGAILAGGIRNVPIVDVIPTLYVSDRTSDLGTPEFPAKWVAASVPNKGRKAFPFLIEVDSGYNQIVKKIDLLISEQPFTASSNVGLPAGVQKVTVTKIEWSKGFFGTDLLNSKGKIYGLFFLSISDGGYKFGPEPDGSYKTFHVRAVPIGADDKPLKASTAVKVNYGSGDNFIPVEAQLPSAVPNFNYSFPEGKSPFAVYLRGQGLKTVKSQVNSKAGIVPLGYHTTANAALGLSYFNFKHLVDSSKPFTEDQDLLSVNFNAVAGVKTGPSNGNETPGATMTLNILGDIKELNFPAAPGGSVIPLEYDCPPAEINYELFSYRFFIGPVPVKVSGSLTGRAGINLYGQVDTSPSSLKVTGTINPFVETSFEAKGGVDVVIAYARLVAKLDPIFRADLLLSFDSQSSKPVTMSQSFRGLNGSVSLEAGFYYPCPSLKKIVGFLTGGEELPLCETKWDYQIFQFGGFGPTNPAFPN